MSQLIQWNRLKEFRQRNKHVSRSILVKLWKIAVAFLLLLCGFASAYFFLAPNLFSQSWESLMYAYGSETQGLGYMLGNHAFSNFLLNFVYVLAVQLGYQGRALPLQIIANSLVGGLTVAVLFFILFRYLRISLAIAAGSAAVFGVSNAFWRSSGSADVYSLTLLLLVLSWASLLQALQQPKYRWMAVAGAIAGVSLVTHQFSGVFFVVALPLILLQKEAWLPRLVVFFSTAGLVALLGQFGLGAIAMQSVDPVKIITWTRGYIDDPVFGDQITLASMRTSLESLAEALVVPRPPYFVKSYFAGLVLALLVPVIVLSGGTQIRRLDPMQRVVFLAASLQIFVSGFLINWFNPIHGSFWLFPLLAWVILLSLALEGIQTSMEAHPIASLPGWLPGVFELSAAMLAVIVLAYNLHYSLVAEHQPDQNTQIAYETWLKHSSPDDMLITAGDLIAPLTFWGNRPNTIHLYHVLVIDRNSLDRFAYMREQIDQTLCQGNEVLIAPAIIDNFQDAFLLWLDLPREDLRGFIASLPMQPVFTYASVYNSGAEPAEVFRIIRTGTCGDQ